MTEFLELESYPSMIPVQVSLLTSIAYQKVLRVSYSSLRKKGVPLNLSMILKNSLTPKVTKVEVTVEGVLNELYAQNMEYHHQYDEIVEHFAEGWLKEAGAIQKDLQLHNVNIALYYTDKYALWLDFRTIDDNRLHGSGRQLENTSEGIRLQITKESGSTGKLSCYLYIFQDAQINISDAQFLNVVY